MNGLKRVQNPVMQAFLPASRTVAPEKPQASAGFKAGGGARGCSRTKTILGRWTLLTCVLAAGGPASWAQRPIPCSAEDVRLGTSSDASEPLPDPRSPRQRLTDMVQAALGRSDMLGAAALTAEASESELKAAVAARAPQASLSAGVGPSSTTSTGVTQSSLVQGQAALQVTQTLWDAGRNEALVDWRKWLAEAANQGRLSVQEQLAASTISLALERSRYRHHVLIYGQYVRKMNCLVQALQDVVAADRGRGSELVQATKSLQQAELSREQAKSQLRQIEIRLRKLVGDGLPASNGLSSVLLTIPELDELRQSLEQSPDISAITAQFNAAERYAQSLEAAMKPQVSWTVGANAALGAGGSSPHRGGSLSAGLSINVPLTLDGPRHVADSARKRARATWLQRDEALSARRSRLDETHDQARATFQRAQQIGTVLASSEQLRDFTLQQWQQLGRRSLFDVMATESEHYSLRVQYVNALHDGQQLNAALLSLGKGLGEWLR